MSPPLARELYDTGTFEAMYLAGMVADGAQLTKKQLQSLADAASNMPLISEYTVRWVAVESPNARELATPSTCRRLKPSSKTVVAQIDAAPNRVRYSMNGFVIAVGAYVAPLLKQAAAAAKQIGVVSVNMGDTACKVRLATDYIAKTEASGRALAKRKTIRC